MSTSLFLQQITAESQGSTQQSLSLLPNLQLGQGMVGTACAHPTQHRLGQLSWSRRIYWRDGCSHSGCWRGLPAAWVFLSTGWLGLHHSMGSKRQQSKDRKWKLLVSEGLGLEVFQCVTSAAFLLAKGQSPIFGCKECQNILEPCLKTTTTGFMGP